MTDKRKEIPQLVKILTLLAKEKKQMILNTYMTADESIINKLHLFLTEAIKKQNALVDKEIAKNPMILSEAKGRILQDALQDIHQMEAISNAQEFRELQELELSIDNII